MDNHKRINISNHTTIPWVDRPPVLVRLSASTLVIQQLSSGSLKEFHQGRTVIVTSRLNKRRYPTQYTQAVVERLRIGYAMAGVQAGCGSNLTHKPPQ